MNRCSNIFFLTGSGHLEHRTVECAPFGDPWCPQLSLLLGCSATTAQYTGHIWLDSSFLGALIFRSRQTLFFCLEFYQIAWNQGGNFPSSALLFLSPSVHPSSLQTSLGHKGEAVSWGLGIAQGLVRMWRNWNSCALLVGI